MCDKFFMECLRSYSRNAEPDTQLKPYLCDLSDEAFSSLPFYERVCDMLRRNVAHLEMDDKRHKFILVYTKRQFDEYVRGAI